MAKIHSSLILIICTLLFSSVVRGQNGGGLPTSSDSVNISYLDSDSSLKPLQKLTPSLSGRGIFRSKAAYEVKGEQAPLKLKPGQPQDFIVRLAPGVDPNKVSLFRFNAERGRRLVQLGTSPAFGNIIVQQVETLPYNINKFDDSSFKLTSVQVLPAGEYGFSISNSSDLFCFGVSEH